MVPGLGSPWPGKVVSHDVENVDLLGHFLEINVLQCPFACWKTGRYNISRGRKVFSKSGKKTNIIMSLLRVCRVFPVHFKSQQGIRPINEDEPSIPSSPNSSTSRRAVWANVSVRALHRATAAKLSLALPPPPMERMILNFEYCRLRRVNARRQPVAPSTGICVSAHSSLNWSLRSAHAQRSSQGRYINSSVFFDPTKQARLVNGLSIETGA